MLEVYGKSDRGNVRENNEDRICYPRADTTSPPPKPEAGQLLIVADGVGGLQAGEHASKLTVDTLKRLYYYGDHTQDPRVLLQKAIGEANEEVLKHTQTDPTLHGAASTVTAAVVKGNQLYVANVGDSRTYLIQANGYCQQITKDHSLTQQKIDRGLIQPEQAKIDPDSHIITRSIGLDPRVDVDTFPIRNTPDIVLQPGDAILLCSDGLTDLVYDDEIARIVARNHPKQAVDQLIKLAKRNGGHDNISAVVGRVPGGPPPSRLAWLPAPATLLTNRWLWAALAVVLLGGSLWGLWLGEWPQFMFSRPAATPPATARSAMRPTTATTPLLVAPVGTASATSEPTSTRIPTQIPGSSAELAQTPTPVAAAVNLPAQPPQATGTPVINQPVMNAPFLVAPDANFSIADNNKTTFAWKWRGELQPNQGFQILLWPVGRKGEQKGIHDAKETINLQPDSNGAYSLNLNVTNTHGNGDYEWTVAVVWLNPYYVIKEAQPRPIKITVAGGGGRRGGGGKPEVPAGVATRAP